MRLFLGVIAGVSGAPHMVGTHLRGDWMGSIFVVCEGGFNIDPIPCCFARSSAHARALALHLYANLYGTRARSSIAHKSARSGTQALISA